MLAFAVADDVSWTRLVRRWRAVSLGLIVFTAVSSEGFYHPDEQFQTLEFAATKLGRASVAELPWESPLRMRGWTQAGLYVLEARLFETLGVSDPFAWALGFRLTSGLLTWLAIGALIRCLPIWFRDLEYRVWALKALCLAWFVPYLAVRTSSECLAASALALGIATVVSARRAESGAAPVRNAVSFIGSGFLLGVAFELRYAVGVAVLGVLVWIVAIEGATLAATLEIGLGVLAAIASAALVDRWGYGAWTLPAVEYFTQNLVADRAEHFGTLPWYGYLLIAAKSPVAPLVLLFMAGCCVAWLRYPRHVMTWATAPLFAVHSLIAHKEMRFLFPVATLGLVLMVLSITPHPGEDAWTARIRRAVEGWPGRLVGAANLLALAGLCLVPNRPQIAFQHFVRERYPSSFEAYLLGTSSPWSVAGLAMNFYRPDALTLHPIEALEGLDHTHFLLIAEGCRPPVEHSCALVYRGLPCWEHEIADRWGGVASWDLYRCKVIP